VLLASNHTWGDKFQNGFNGLFDFVPNLIGFVAVLAIGYFVAKLVGGLVGNLLQRAGLDRMLTEGQGGGYVSKVTASPSRLLGRIAFWALFLGGLSLAVSVLGIAALTAFVGAILAYAPNVVAALLIFLVAGALAAGLAALAARTMGETPTGKVIATVAPGLVMAIAIFMILNQLRIAPEIVTITYGALIGALALAAALAFGLGGRDVAARMLEGAYARGQASRETVASDLAQAKENARADVERTRSTADEWRERQPAGR
jgi:Conserved TM helix